MGCWSGRVWVPPDGYFTPYFDGIGVQVQNILAPMEGNFDQRFEHQHDFLLQRFINPVQTSMQNLAERMEQLATWEEVQGVRNDLVAHIQDFTQFRRSHNTFTTHFYHLYPSVTLGTLNLFNSQASYFSIANCTSDFYDHLTHTRVSFASTTHMPSYASHPQGYPSSSSTPTNTYLIPFNSNTITLLNPT